MGDNRRNWWSLYWRCMEPTFCQCYITVNSRQDLNISVMNYSCIRVYLVLQWSVGGQIFYSSQCALALHVLLMSGGWLLFKWMQHYYSKTFWNGVVLTAVPANFHVNPIFYRSDIGWNLGLTWQIPNPNSGENIRNLPDLLMRVQLPVVTHSGGEIWDWHGKFQALNVAKMQKFSESLNGRSVISCHTFRGEIWDWHGKCQVLNVAKLRNLPIF